jgi:transmembrane sensor
MRMMRPPPAPVATKAETSETQSDEAVAAQWIVGLSADDPAERARTHRRFEAWKRIDPRHAAIAARMEGFIAAVRGLSAADTRASNEARAARKTLEALLPAPTSCKRKRTIGLSGLLFVCGLLGAAIASDSRYWWADLRTAPNEQRTTTLADGSRLVLNGATALNYRDDAEHRRVELLRGEILVDVAKDPTRPFIVETAQGRITALGTRFIVRRDAQATDLTMIESRTRVSASAPNTPDGHGEATLVAGERARMTSTGIELLDAIDPAAAEAAFRQRQLVVQNRPLPQVLDELARQRPGYLHYDRAALEDLRVFAVLPLDDPDRALQLLGVNFPQLRIRHFGERVVWIDLRD